MRRHHIALAGLLLGCPSTPADPVVARDPPSAPEEAPKRPPDPLPPKVDAEPRLDVPPPQPPTRVFLPLKGKVLAHGGGPIGRAVFDQFAELCGSKGRLVVVPTASEAADKPGYAKKLPAPWLRRGLASVDVLHTLDRTRAGEISFLAPLEAANCVWFGGGAQGRLIDTYVGTGFEDSLHRLLLRGGVVGGYSAGAAIMSRSMIRQGNPIPEEAVGFGILPGVIIDQHFLAHEREPRLKEMVRRHPELVGFGIDEGTWVVFSDRAFEVFGESVLRRCTASGGCDDLAAGAHGRLLDPVAPPPD